MATANKRLARTNKTGTNVEATEREWRQILACLMAALFGANQSWEGSVIRFAGLGLLCLYLSVLPGAADAASCVVPRFRTHENQTVTGTMYVVSGNRCGINLLQSAGPIHGTNLISRPSKGSVSIHGTRVVYVSSAGYVGDDHFTYAWQGLNRLNQPVTKTVDVNVKVSAQL